MARGKLCAGLPPAPAKPRNPVLSGLALQLVRDRRQLRTLRRRVCASYDRLLLCFCFQGWRCSQARTDSTSRSNDALTRASWRVYRVGFALVAADRGLYSQLQLDKADFARRAMAQARDAGPAQFAHRIRAILPAGRKYKAPRLLKGLRVGDCTFSGDLDILQALGQHFAEPKRASKVSGADLLQAFEGTLPLDASLDFGSIPDITELVWGIASLKSHKAPGPSGLPAAVFKAAPLSGTGLVPAFGQDGCPRSGPGAACRRLVPCHTQICEPSPQHGGMAFDIAA